MARSAAAQLHARLGKASRRTRISLLVAFVLIVGIFVAGTVGYVAIEGWTVREAFYMTVITVGTVGYREVHELGPHGQMFTALLILASFGTVGYSLTVIGAFVIEGELQDLLRGRRMDKRIAGLSDHIIVCGAGRTGFTVIQEFLETGTRFVVVDRDPETLARWRDDPRAACLLGDATDDDMLENAGIARARGLIAALKEDKDNVFVVLSARASNPGLFIVARLENPHNAEKLRKAGADQLVSPNAIGGMRMASLMIRRHVVDFLDRMLRAPGGGLRIEEVPVAADRSLADRTLGEINIGRRFGVLVVGIRAVAGDYTFNPGRDTRLTPGDILVVMGAHDQVRALREWGEGDAGA